VYFARERKRAENYNKYHNRFIFFETAIGISAISNRNSFVSECCLIKLLPCILPEKYIYILRVPLAGKGEGEIRKKSDPKFCGTAAVTVPRWDCGGSTGPSNSWLGPKFDRPLNSAVLLTHCGQLILRKISKFDATRCPILKPKCTIFDFRWGSAPDTAGRAYSALPDLLAVIKGVYF